MPIICKLRSINWFCGILTIWCFIVGCTHTNDTNIEVNSSDSFYFVQELLKGLFVIPNDLNSSQGFFPSKKPSQKFIDQWGEAMTNVCKIHKYRIENTALKNGKKLNLSNLQARLSKTGVRVKLDWKSKTIYIPVEIIRRLCKNSVDSGLKDQSLMPIKLDMNSFDDFIVKLFSIENIPFPKPTDLDLADRYNAEVFVKMLAETVKNDVFNGIFFILSHECFHLWFGEESGGVKEELLADKFGMLTIVHNRQRELELYHTFKITDDDKMWTYYFGRKLYDVISEIYTEKIFLEESIFHPSMKERIKIIKDTYDDKRLGEEALIGFFNDYRSYKESMSDGYN